MLKLAHQNKNSTSHEINYIAQVILLNIQFIGKSRLHFTRGKVTLPIWWLMEKAALEANVAYRRTISESTEHPVEPCASYCIEKFNLINNNS